MKKSMKCSISTPEGMLFTDRIKSCVLPAIDGEWMIMQDHAPMIILLGEGGLRLDFEKKNHYFYLRSGLGQVSHKLIFGVTDQSRSDLNEGTIPEDIKQLFVNNNYSLSEQAKLVVVDKGKEWIIEDKKKKYYGEYIKDSKELNLFKETDVLIICDYAQDATKLSYEELKKESEQGSRSANIQLRVLDKFQQKNAG